MNNKRHLLLHSASYRGALEMVGALVVIGDRVETLRFHDMEISNDSGQPIVFAVGLVHVTRIDGVPVVDLVRLNGPRCVGRVI